MMGKISARHKKTLAAAEDALEASPDSAQIPLGNDAVPFLGDPKAELRARARQLRGR